MAYTDSINKNHSSTFNTLLAFGHTFINNQAIDVAKTITFPLGYDVTDTTSEASMAFKVVFTNGHNSTLVESTPANMTLNNILIVVNKNGSLVPLPIHNMSGTYKCLQPNTCLELYYTANYDGNNTPAYVIIGNPIVLSSSNYTIYADGGGTVDTVQNGNMSAVTSNAVYDYLNDTYKALRIGTTNVGGTGAIWIA